MTTAAQTLNPPSQEELSNTSSLPKNTVATPDNYVAAFEKHLKVAFPKKKDCKIILPCEINTNWVAKTTGDRLARYEWRLEDD